MRGARVRWLVALLVASVAAGLSFPPLIADPDTGGPPSAYADEPIGDLPGVRYERVSDDPGPSRRDQRRARTAALIDPAVRAAIAGQRARVVLVRPYDADGDMPPNDPCRSTGCIDVTIYLYGTDEILDAFVLPSGRVVGIERSVGQPPLSTAERRRAHRLAEVDPDVVTALDGRPHTHPAVLVKPMWPSGVCDRHRCGTVLFMLGDFARTGIGRQLGVVVDLSTGTVVLRTPIECTPVCRVGWEA